jgi:hypothetical protein
MSTQESDEKLSRNRAFPTPGVKSAAPGPFDATLGGAEVTGVAAGAAAMTGACAIAGIAAGVLVSSFAC